MYLSSNGIKKIENLNNLTELTTLDLAQNQIEKLENLESLEKLEELWMNDNKLSEWKLIDILKGLKNLKTVYFESNPISKDVMYRKKLMLINPNLEQIDANISKMSK